MYKWRGQPLSVYVLQQRASARGTAPELVERLGQEEIIWSRAAAPTRSSRADRPSDIEHVALYVAANRTLELQDRERSDQGTRTHDQRLAG